MLKRWIGQAFLKAAGWKMDGERPATDCYVIIAAPHTSNWDMPFMLAMAFVYDIPVRWMGKHTLFKPPFGPFFKRLGGIPIVRHQPGGVVRQMIEKGMERLTGKSSLAEALGEAHRAGLVDEAPNGDYRFAHALTREAADGLRSGRMSRRVASVGGR